ncbi:MAG: energy-coupling factor transporter transmembrane component T [Eubacteriales bacterium]
MSDTFSSFHPLVGFVYFLLVMGFSMFLLHPICLGISLVCAVLYSLYLRGRRAAWLSLRVLLPMLILTTLLNPTFNHKGATILTYLPDGNPLTLESIAYGFGAGMLLCCVVCWFSCYNAVMTSDKFIYLFGRVIPSLSLILSMVLRFVPRFSSQFRIVANAQKCIGRDKSGDGFVKRIKHGVRIMSVMVTWTLENAIDTSDSMKSRGYGLSGRSAFSVYRMERRDWWALALILVLGGYLAVGAARGALAWSYIPRMEGAGITPYSLSLFLCFLLLCVTPLAINIKEDFKWRAIQSRL